MSRYRPKDNIFKILCSWVKICDLYSSQVQESSMLCCQHGVLIEGRDHDSTILLGQKIPEKRQKIPKKGHKMVKNQNFEKLLKMCLDIDLKIIFSKYNVPGSKCVTCSSSTDRGYPKNAKKYL